MIHIHLLDILGNQTGEVIVSQAKAHADFPMTQSCAAAPHLGSVSGHAAIAEAFTEPSLVDALVGYVAIPSFGGKAKYQTASVTLPADSSTLSAKVATSSTIGSVTDTLATSTSFADIATACVLPIAGSCAIGATAIHVQSQSSSDSTDDRQLRPRQARTSST